MIFVTVDWPGLLCVALEGSFCRGSLRRFCEAAAERFEREMAVLSEPYVIFVRIMNRSSTH